MCVDNQLNRLNSENRRKNSKKTSQERVRNGSHITISIALFGGQVGQVGQVGQDGQIGQVGQVGQAGQAGQAGHGCQGGQIGQDGWVPHAMKCRLYIWKHFIRFW